MCAINSHIIFYRKMADIKNVLFDEIRRLARKEVKAAVTPLQSKVSELRKAVAALSRELKVSVSEKPKALEPEAGAEASAEKPSKKFRFNAASVKKLRAKFGLSQAEFAKLVGVSMLTVSCWELGKTSPRAGAKARLAELRSMGKREIARVRAEKKEPAPEENPGQ